MSALPVPGVSVQPGGLSWSPLAPLSPTTAAGAPFISNQSCCSPSPAASQVVLEEEEERLLLYSGSDARIVGGNSFFFFFFPLFVFLLSLSSLFSPALGFRCLQCRSPHAMPPTPPP